MSFCKQVSTVHDFVKKRRDRPRLGTAVSIPLTIDKGIERQLFPNGGIDDNDEDE